MNLDLASILITAAALICGLVIHESAHALAAYLLGDHTAHDRRRISLNPLNHIDPFGTVILPLIMLALGGPVFAFAKPVPVYLDNLKHPKRDEVIVAFAGPGSNLLLAGLGALLLKGMVGLASAGTIPYAMGTQAAEFFVTFILVNLSLAFFNLIPVPPLDGSSILVPFLRGRARAQYYRIQQYAMPILIVALYLLPTVFHLNIIAYYFQVTVYPLANALIWFALA